MGIRLRTPRAPLLVTPCVSANRNLAGANGPRNVSLSSPKSHLPFSLSPFSMSITRAVEGGSKADQTFLIRLDCQGFANYL